MSLDSKQKRGAAINLGLPGRQWLAEPDGTLLSTDRLSVVTFGSAEAPVAPLTVAQQMDWLFHTPDFALSRKPNVAVGNFTLQPIQASPLPDGWMFHQPDFARAHAPRPRGGMVAPEPIRPAPTVDAWAFHQPDFARKHPPRPHGGLFTAYPIRPEPTLEMWEFKPPDFAKGHAPRPRGGMFAPEPIRPHPIVSDWMFHQPDFAARQRLPLVRTGLYAADTTTPPDPAPELSWHPQYQDWHVYRWRQSRAWYHPALQGPFTVSDLVHTNFIHATWFIEPSVGGRFAMCPAVDATFGIKVSASGTQGINP